MQDYRTIARTKGRTVQRNRHSRTKTWHFCEAQTRVISNACKELLTSGPGAIRLRRLHRLGRLRRAFRSCAGTRHFNSFINYSAKNLKGRRQTRDEEIRGGRTAAATRPTASSWLFSTMPPLSVGNVALWSLLRFELLYKLTNISLTFVLCKFILYITRA